MIYSTCLCYKANGNMLLLQGKWGNVFYNLLPLQGKRNNIFYVLPQQGSDFDYDDHFRLDMVSYLPVYGEDT